ncbi:hypothetical protein [Serratia fonticola]|uniref:hypothetical protein n=1 Tax=Serratia fonticola TaxID=47917 RepID=UPI002179DE4B|nr:hypothetical protein [Serratia fonticola]CAI1767893.1 Uncharacterised protein [Serratia fonticola]
MLSNPIFNNTVTTLPPPLRETLSKHASFLRNHCDVPLGHAQQMVAYSHHFSSWAELNSRSPEAQDLLALNNMKKMRESIQAFRDKMPPDELLQIANLKASVGTLTRAVEENRIMQLNDYDIILLHNTIHEEIDDEQLIPAPLFEALYTADHCLVLLAKRVAARGYTKTVNPHLYFPWFSFRMYGYLHIDGSTLNYDCRELDSYLFPSEDKDAVLFNRPWFVAYVMGFIRSLLRTLNDSGYTGRLTFNNICNERLIEEKPYFVGDQLLYNPFINRNSNTDRAISALIDAMLSLGADKNNKYQWIAFHYGNAEVY